MYLVKSLETFNSMETCKDMDKMSNVTSKVERPSIGDRVSNFFNSFNDLETKTASLVTKTCLDLFVFISDCLMRGYFEKEVELKNGKDAKLKQTLSQEIAGILADQSADSAVVAELEAIPDSLWNDNNKAQCKAFMVEYVASTQKYNLSVGSYMRTVRAVLQWHAETNGRMALWHFLHQDTDSMIEGFSELRQDYDNRHAVKVVAEETSEKEESEDNGNGDGDDGSSLVDTSEMDDIVQAAFKDLGHALAEADLSKQQQGAIAKMLKKITAHVESLTQGKDDGKPVVAESVAPKVTKKEAVKKAASK